MLRPPPQLSVSAWAEQHRILSSRGSSEPGPWRTARAPYLRAIMDALHRAAAAALETAPVANRLRAAGVTPSAIEPAAFRAMLAEEIAGWGDVVRAAGVRVS